MLATFPSHLQQSLRLVMAVGACFSSYSARGGDAAAAFRGLGNPPIFEKVVAKLDGLWSQTPWMQPDRSMPTREELRITTLVPISHPTDDELKSAAADRAAINRALGAHKGVVSITRSRGKSVLYRVVDGLASQAEINQHPYVTVYAAGSGDNLTMFGNDPAQCVYTAIKAGTILGPCITFTFPITRAKFNYSQEQDIACVAETLEVAHQQYPHKKFVLHGACHGANTLLRYSARHKDFTNEHVAAIVAESPVISPNETLTWPWGLRPVVLALAKRVMPNFKPDTLRTVFDDNDQPSVPTLILSLPHDTMSTLPVTKRAAEHMRAHSPAGRVIEHFVTKDSNITHGQAGRSIGVRTVCAAFKTTHASQSVSDVPLH